MLDGSVSGNIFNLTGSVTDAFSDFTLTNATGAAITGSASAFAAVSGISFVNNGDGLLNLNATVTNSTFAGNSAAIDGGTVTLQDSTVSGGGIGIQNTALTSGNSIIAGNTTDVGSGISGTSLGHNLIGVGGALFINGLNGDQVGSVVSPVNPLLTALGNYGGPTSTYAILAGSPAIDAGSNALVPGGLTTDQRGVGFSRIYNGTVDIGALEFQVQQTPEPATCATCLLGLAIVATRLRKR